MAHLVWDGRESEIAAEAAREWLSSADEDGTLLVTHLDTARVSAWLGHPDLEGGEVYRVSADVAHVRWSSLKARQAESRREHEHRELLLILQDALIEISHHDQDVASRLAARAYVNLKTDPRGQRRFDGLLHRFTGVLHRRPPSDPAPTS